MKGFRNGTGAGFALALTLAGALAGQAAQAQTAQAQTATPEAIAALSRAIAEVGCSVTMQNQQTVAAAAGLRNEEAALAARHLFETGQATIRDGSTLQLLSGDCAQGAAPEAPALLVAVIEALRGNGCAMSQRQGDAILTGLGDREGIRHHIGELRDSGLARVTDQARVLVLSQPLCTANSAQLQVLAGNVAALAGAGGEDFAPSRMGAARMLVGRMRETGCALPAAEAQAVLDDAAIDGAQALLADLSDGGLLRAADAGFELGKAACKLADDQMAGLLAEHVTGPGAD